MKTLLTATAALAVAATAGAASAQNYSYPAQPQGYAAPQGYTAPQGYAAQQGARGYTVQQPYGAPQGGYAQVPPATPTFPQGGYPQGPVAGGQSGPQGGFQGGFQGGGLQQQPINHTGVMGASPRVAALFTNTAYRAVQGSVMGVATYAPNGECGVTIGGRTGGRKMSAQGCRYTVREIGPNRISMTVTAVFNGRRTTETSTNVIRPDGSLFDEKTRIVAVRIK